MSKMNPIELSLFSSRVSAICDEMGIVLRRTAFSPNIKDRLDFSCALFGPSGELFAQAAHIPVHLGSMAFAMGNIVEEVDWQQGDLLAVNDPYLGGTHLPDVTLISPVFFQGQEGLSRATKLIGFVANRAHHANIGCDTPGSMPVSSTLEEEGVIIPPTLIVRDGKLLPGASLLPEIDDVLSGDFAAQAGANQVGVERLTQLVNKTGEAAYRTAMEQLNDYADRITQSVIATLKPGRSVFSDTLDDDGKGSKNIKLEVSLNIHDSYVELDFTGCSDQVPGNLNCPEAVAAAASYYCFRCLMPADVPACAGLFRRIKLITRKGSIVNANRPAAVAAGNVETSTRLVDLVFGALAMTLPKRIPAASQGTMNNVAMGHIDPITGERWDYYETIAGGLGGGPNYPGLDAVHSHMTNTLNTPIESLEMNYPLRIRRYEKRKGSGGIGLHPGGEGVIRQYQFLRPAQLSLLTERRLKGPWGLAGGGDGEVGVNLLNGEAIPAKCNLSVATGDLLTLMTPGAGGWGSPESPDSTDSGAVDAFVDNEIFGTP
ncbi:MAG: N-methylhydantoinase B [Pseudohongiellaceae bacterium]|jgi:N-methylhydantoinase B